MVLGGVPTGQSVRIAASIDKESNWLPAADGDFSATVRIYWHKPAALDGVWESTPLTQAR